MAWSPQRSKDTYAPIRSVAYARTHGGFEPPPDPPGSIMYLVCNRRRQIWALKPNTTGSGPAFQVLATRGPLYPDTQQFRSTMGDIGGDSSGAWYTETPAITNHVGGPPTVTYEEGVPTVLVLGGSTTPRTTRPIIHRLDPELNLVASYDFVFQSSTGFGSAGWPFVSQPALGMGGGSNMIVPAYHRNYQDVGWSGNPGPNVNNAPGGLVAISVNQMAAQADRVYHNGTSHVYVRWANDPPHTLAVASQVTAGLPLAGYENILSQTTPRVTSCDGDGGNFYACDLSSNGPAYMARWSGGQLVAYKTPANATQQDQFRAQCIGGSSSVCYTTENNNEIVLRDGSLTLVRRLLRVEIESIVGPVSPINGASNFTFTGIGGR